MANLEKIRKQKLEDLQHVQQTSAEQDFVKQQLEGVKKTVLQRFLTKDARERLANIRTANPQLAEQVELALVDAAQLNQISEQLTDEQLKGILARASSTKKEFRIIH